MFVSVLSGLSWSERRFQSRTGVNRSSSSSSIGFSSFLTGEKSSSCSNTSSSSSAGGSVSSRLLWVPSSSPVRFVVPSSSSSVGWLLRVSCGLVLPCVRLWRSSLSHVRDCVEPWVELLSSSIVGALFARACCVFVGCAGSCAEFSSWLLSTNPLSRPVWMVPSLVSLRFLVWSASLWL